MNSHYVVQMKVLRVDIEDPPGKTTGSYGRSDSPVVEKPRRTVTEIADHTLKGDVFEKTIEKAQAYLALAEDFDGIDDIPKGNTR